MRQTLNTYEALDRIANLTLGATPLETLLNEVLQAILTVSWLQPTPSGVIFLTDPASGSLRRVAGYGPDADTLATDVPQISLNDPDSSTNERVREQAGFAVPVEDQNGTPLGLFVFHPGDPAALANAEVGFLRTVARMLAATIARQTIVDSRDYLGRIVEEAACEIYEFDAETLRFLNANRAAVDNLGYSREELLELTPVDLLLTESTEDFDMLVEPVRHGHLANIRFESIQRRKNGTCYDVDAAIQLLSHRDGNRYVAILNDISQQKNLTNLLNTTIDSFPGGIAVFSKELSLTLANPAFYDIFNLREEDYPLGSSFEELIRLRAENDELETENADQIVQYLVKEVSSSKEHHLEWTGPDGSVWEIRGKPMAGGGFVSTHMNITRRRIAEREAVEAEERLLTALETIEEGFVLYDAEDRLVLCNSKYKEIYAESEDLMVPGTSFADILRGGLARGQYAGSEGREDEWLEERLALHRRKYPVTSEQQLGNGRWIFLAEQPMPGGGVVGIRVDITERKLTELELASYRQHLEELVADRTMQVEMQAARLVEALEHETELNEIQRQFVSMASHEFRTPLAIIDGAAQRLVRRAARAQPDEVVERATRIRSAIKQMIGLMESTLAAERIDNGTFMIEFSPCRIRNLIEDCCDQQRYIAPKAQIRTRLAGLPEVIDADSAALESVFNNLLSNAIKYSPHDPTIDVSGETVGDTIRIRVRDNGLGIDEDDIPKLFSRYFRARTSSGIPGTGIGLNLVRRIVDKHGGSVGVASVRDEGSTFELTLPIRHAAMEPQPSMASNF